MADELPEAAPPTAALALPPNPFGLLQMAIEKGMGADELGKLMDLAERWQKLQARQAHAAALAGFQADCPPVEKKRTADAGGKFNYRYASYDDVNKTAKPHMEKWGLSISFDTATPKVGVVLVTARVAHEQGHVEATALEVPIPAMTVNDTQRFGAAISYAKRYAMCAALNIVVTDEDVDGAMLELITTEEAEELSAMILRCGSAAHLPKFVKWAGGTPPEPGELTVEKAMQALCSIPGTSMEKARKALAAKLAEKGETYP